MNILFCSSSPRRSDSCSKQVVTDLVGNLRQGLPDARASDIIEARRALIAELEQRRRAAAPPLPRAEAAQHHGSPDEVHREPARGEVS